MALTKKQLKTLASFADFSDIQVEDMKKNPDLLRAYLRVAFENYAQDKNRDLLKNCLGIAVRALGASKVSRDSKLDRSGLYKAFSPKGNPRFDTLFNVLDCAGIALVPRCK